MASILFQQCKERVNKRLNGVIIWPRQGRTDGVWFGYFDNDNGQTLFLDSILMDIMVDNGEILWKFSVSVMVYIY